MQQPAGSPSPDFLPAKTRRAARAYHQDMPDTTAFQPPPHPDPHSFPQSQHPAQVSPPAYQQHPSSYSTEPQHPYANAPPPGPPPSLAHGIPQPPHSAGQKLSGPRPRIDPDQIPSPVTVRAEDQRRFEHDAFLTCSRAGVPLASTDYVAVDQGNSNPRFMRLTTYALPTTDDLANAAHIPLGLVIQPLAPLKPEEGEVPVVDFGESGPPRCAQCRGYINPWCVFIDGGQKFICNLCGAATPSKFSGPRRRPAK
jgi:protein transport protein SEC24